MTAFRNVVNEARFTQRNIYNLFLHNNSFDTQIPALGQESYNFLPAPLNMVTTNIEGVT